MALTEIATSSARARRWRSTCRVRRGALARLRLILGTPHVAGTKLWRAGEHTRLRIAAPPARGSRWSPSATAVPMYDYRRSSTSTHEPLRVVLGPRASCPQWHGSACAAIPKVPCTRKPAETVLTSEPGVGLRYPAAGVPGNAGPLMKSRDCGIRRHAWLSDSRSACNV